MSIHTGGGKWSDVYINGNSWERAYLNGDLIFLKSQPGPTTNFCTLWWDDGAGNITEESIETLTDWNALFSSPVLLSNSHAFTFSQIVDFKFGNDANFPSTIDNGLGYNWTNLDVGSESGDTTWTIPDNVTTISNRFFDHSSVNASSIDMNNVDDIGDYFLANSPFNGNIVNCDASTIADYFLADCYQFNKPLSINPYSIGDWFLSINSNQANAMNSNINLGSRLEYIGSHFISGFSNSYEHKFDATLTIPNTLENIGSHFLSYCKYSGAINLGSSAVYDIGDHFCSYGYISSLTLPTGQSCTIGDSFLRAKQTTLNSLTIPANIDSIGGAFLFSGEDFYVTSQLIVNADPSTWPADTAEINCCYGKHNSSDIQFMRVTGTYATQFKTKYPESSTSVSYDAARYYS